MIKAQAKTKDKNKSAHRASSAARSVTISETSLLNQDSAIRNILSSPVQRKISIGAPGDQYEREADAVAEKVVAGEQVSKISKISSLASTENQPQRQAGIGEELLQSKPKEDEDEEIRAKLIQREVKEENEEEVQTKLIQREVKEDEEEIQTKLIQREVKEENEEEVQTKLIQREAKEDEEEIQTKLIQREVKEEDEEVQTKLIQREAKEDEEEQVQTKLIQREEKEVDEESLQTKPGSTTSSDSSISSAESAINNSSSGRPINPTTRQTLESGIGADFSQVRVHEDSVAKKSAKDLNARAFTYKNDIWLGEGESQNDTKLMAHEATHVVQQNSGLMQKTLQRDAVAGSNAIEENEPAPVPEEELPLVTGRPDTSSMTITFSEIDIPRFKMADHRGDLYTGNTLKRKAGYDRGNPGQRDKWKNELNKSNIRTILEDKIKRANNITTVDGSATHVFEVPVQGRGARPYLFGDLDTLSRELTTPMWGGVSRQPPLRFFHVDHIVELQIANWNGETWGNNLSNMELLDGDINERSGRDIRQNIINKVNAFRTATGDRFGTSVEDIKSRYDLAFQRPVARGGTARTTATQFWKRSDIEAGRHLNSVRAANPSVLGQEGRVRVFSTTSGGLGKSFRWPDPLNSDERNWLKPFVITEKQFNTEASGEDASNNFGHLKINIPADDENWQQFSNDEVIPVERVPGARYAGYISKQAVRSKLYSLRHKKTSPVRIDTFELLPDTGIYVAGAILPELPLISGLDLGFELRNGGLRIYKEFTAEELNVPAPFSVRSASLRLFADTEAGLGADGRVDFGIDNVGEGYLEASVSTGGGLGFGGGFDFDSDLFDPASVEIAYIDNVFRGSADLGIPEGKVTGVKSALLHVDINGENISGTGTVEPQINAIRQGQATFSYGPETGLSFGISMELSDSIPNVNSGAISAEISKKPSAENYALKAHGVLEAGMAGFTATVTADYDDGLFIVEGEGNYERGMLAGSVLVGATNRLVDEQGNPTDEISEDITAYGGGSVTVQIAPWLQGTVGIRLLANGEIEITGEIGLPDVLEVFPEKRLDKNIFSINLDIPILGFAVAGQRVGIFATIGGGLDLSAGVGPGQLQELGLAITYNPDHEDQTHVSGGAKLVIPADAGLRLFIRGALGAGIPIVSAQLGLEVGGQLGLEGAAEAGVQVDWTPQQGLVLDALGEIYVEPKFRFDLTGFALVEADLFITTIELYSERWELAAFELGPDLRFGVRFPIHYEENQPFELSWDNVEFDVPDVDTDELLDDLVKQII